MTAETTSPTHAEAQTPATLEEMAALRLVERLCSAAKASRCLFQDRDASDLEAAADMIIALSRPSAVAPGVPAGVVLDYLEANAAYGLAKSDWGPGRSRHDLIATSARARRARAALDAALSPDAQTGAVESEKPRFPEANIEDHLRYLTAFVESSHLPEGVKADAEDAIRSIARLAASTTPAGGLPGMEAIAEARKAALTEVLQHVDALAASYRRSARLATHPTSVPLNEDRASTVEAIARDITARIDRLTAAGTGDDGRAVGAAGLPIRIPYLNWRGEQTTPRIVPMRIFWGSNEWHLEPCWLIEAVDLDKGAVRTYALDRIGHAPPPAPAQPLVAGWSDLTDIQRDQFRDSIAGVLGKAMDCTRVWSAWGYGTMTEDDFSVIGYDVARLEEISETAFAAAIAASSSDRGGATDGWRGIGSAPYGMEVEVRAGMMTFRAKLFPGGSENADGKPCDQWRATREGEHPPCWSEGACWESNADESPSLQPDAWRPLPTTTTEIAR